jgi:hypothetical protein
MTATMLAALLALAVNAPAQAPVVVQAKPAHGEHHGEHHGRDRDRCARSVDSAFVQLDRALQALGDDIDRVGNPNDRRRLRDELTAAIRASERAHDDACEAAQAPPSPPVVIVQPPPPPPPPPPRLIEGNDFKDLVGAIKAEHFDDGRKRVVDGAMAGTVCITTDQARTLIALPAFSDGKLGMARAVVPHIIDGDRAYLLTNAFTFNSDKEQFAAILKTVGTQCR